MRFGALSISTSNKRLITCIIKLMSENRSNFPTHRYSKFHFQIDQLSKTFLIA